MAIKLSGTTVIDDSRNATFVNTSSSGTITFSGGTANTLLYLNASKQVSSLSTLSFDGTNVGVNNASPGSTLDVKGILRLTGSSSGYVGLQAAASGTNQTYTLPASDGLNGQVLQTNGVGSLSWVNQSAGGGGGSSGSGTSTSRTSFTATGGQTTFSVNYVVDQLDVYLNGSKLVANNDFTANNGTSVVLSLPAVAGDVLEAVVYSSQWITSGVNLYYSSGNIGVGTTNPAARVHAASANTAFAVGTIRVDGADSAGTVNAPVTINAATGGGTGNGGSQMYFETRTENGSLTERMRIDHNGRVRIGTTSNNYALDVGNVAGGNMFRFTRDGVELGSFISGGNPFIGSTSNHPILLMSNSTERMRITTDGQLLIGATSASLGTAGSIYIPTGAFIHENGFGRFWIRPGQQIGSATYAGLYGPALTYLVKYSGGWKSTGGGNASALTIDEGIFSFSNAGTLTAPEESVSWNTRMIIDASGNILIGSSTSSYATSGRGLIELNGSSTSLIAVKVGETARGYFAASSSSTELSAVGASQPLVFTTNGAERGRITTGGDLLIGTTTSGAKISVVTASYTGLGISGNPTSWTGSDIGITRTGAEVSTVGQAPAIQLTNSTTNSNIIIQQHSNNIQFFNFTGGSWTERARITSDGNLIIGKTTTSTQTNGILLNGSGTQTNSFAVTSNQAFIFNNTTTGTTYYITFRTNDVERGSISVTDTSTSFNTTSDYRLKENEQPIPNVIERFKKLKPYKFSWKENGDIDEGFFAHELAEVCPNIVSGEKDAVDETGKIKSQSVDYGKLTPFLTAVISNLLERIEQLESKLESSEERK